MASAAKRAGTKTIAVFGPVSATASATGVEHRDPLDALAALAGRDAGDDVRPVLQVPGRVERALAPVMPWTTRRVSRSTMIAIYGRHPLSAIAVERDPVAVDPRRPRSSRTRSASAAARSRIARATPRSRIGRSSTRRVLRPRRPAPSKSAPPLGLRRSCARAKGRAARSASSAALPMSRLSTTSTRSAATRAISRTAGCDVGEVVRRNPAGDDVEASVGERAGPRRRPARPRCIPGAGSTVTTSSPASRSRRATWPPPEATSSAVRAPSRPLDQQVEVRRLCGALRSAGRPRRGRPRRSLTGATPPARPRRASSPRRRGSAARPRSASASPPRRSCRRGARRSDGRSPSGRAPSGSRARPRRSA